MSFDLAIIGITIALMLLIIFFSAVVLYLSFRIKETFRKETRRGVTMAKIGFLIGVLFLAGGMFYFFAKTLENITVPTSTPSPSPSPTPAPSPTAPTPTPTPAPSPTPTPTLNLTISYPPSTRVDTIITVSFTVINPTVIPAHGATIQADILFTNFKIQSSTHEVIGNVVKIGDVPPGTTIVSLQLLTPNKPGVVTDTVRLLFQEMAAPITQEISIYIRGGF